MWPVVKEFCDHGCCAVVLVRCLTSGRILAYCHDCGAAWLTPRDLAQRAYGIGSRLCPASIEIPDREEVAASHWGSDVLRLMPESEYSTASEINARLARERVSRPD